MLKILVILKKIFKIENDFPIFSQVTKMTLSWNSDIVPRKVLRYQRMKNDRQCNDQTKEKKDKKTNNGWQNSTLKIKDWAKWTPLEIQSELSCSGKNAIIPVKKVE